MKRARWYPVIETEDGELVCSAVLEVFVSRSDKSTSRMRDDDSSYFRITSPGRRLSRRRSKREIREAFEKERILMTNLAAKAFGIPTRGAAIADA